ncbi:hypothetical protein DM860_003523 [Cuscuta australis]|uniref:Negative regulator of systemic acquired resistance SNI1 n=2 Tax=Cuscuta sect. Cleistogrammica TaxID=1824901 RepID=A0A328DGU9_9ASTE|nr:hypothetical protein DM860_003523 [Cuscuta australis]
MARQRGGNGRGMEENTMAILDTSGFNRDSRHRNDDRLAFLEAVRSASLVPEDAVAPTKTMFGAIFQILKDESTLELVVASYQLLNELDKRFPRVHHPMIEKSDSYSPAHCNTLVVDEEAWSPFNYGLDSEKVESSTDSGLSINPLEFHSLVQDLGEVFEEKPEASEIKTLRSMLLFQYLVNVLERDFLLRNSAYKENMNWNLVRESLLNMLLGSRKVVYKNFVKDCLSSMCSMYHEMNNTQSMTTTNSSAAVAMALPEAKHCACVSLKKLLFLIIELDSSRNKADSQGLTTRSDGVRTPVSEIILDEITYNSDTLSFLQIFDEPGQKLKLILQYFQKYIPKTSARNKKSNGLGNPATFESILKCFSNANSTRSIMKKISGEAAQFLLGHAFQAYLSMSVRRSEECSTDSKEDVDNSSLPEICQKIVTAFTWIKRENKVTGISHFGKEALFTAATILSSSS